MQDLINLLKGLNNYINNNNLDEFISKFSILEAEKSTLQEELNKYRKECTELKAQLTNTIKEKDIKNKTLEDEIASYRKSSILATMNKQLKEKNEYIAILEQQVRLYKSKPEQTAEQVPVKEITKELSIDTISQSKKENSDKIQISAPIEVEANDKSVEKIVAELVVEQVDESLKKPKKNKSKKKKLDGYEKIEHKDIIYLKNIETNELFAFIDGEIGEQVGRVTSKGKVRLD